MKSYKIFSVLIAIALLTACKANEEPPVSLDLQSSESSSVSNTTTFVTTTTPATTTVPVTTTTTPSVNVEPCDYIMYATGKTNIREEMDNTSNIIDTIDKNTPVNVIGIYDNGWVEVYYNNQNYYCMKSNLTFDEPVIETTPPQTTTPTTTLIEEKPVTTVATTTKADNSAVIAQINEEIELLEYENSIYKDAIEENKGYISQYNDAISEIKNEYLKDAETQLSNAKKKTVLVYEEGKGFVEKPDQSAINEAQEYVDYINSLIEQAKTEIEIIKKTNEEYQVLIDSNNSKIAVYQAEISELS